MKKIIAVLAATLAPTTAMASDGNIFDGYGSIAAGYNSIDGGSWSQDVIYGNGDTNSDSGSSPWKSDGLALEARASAAVPLGGSFAAQVDGVFARTSLNRGGCPECDNIVTDTSTFAVHAFKRKPGKWLLGAIAERYTESGYFSWGQTVYYAGGEGQLFLGRVTLYGQVAYGSIDLTPRVNAAGVNAAMQLRFFPKDNLMLSIRGGHENQKLHYDYYDSNCTDQCQKISGNAWALGAKVEYRLPKSRVSFLADFDYRDLGMDQHYTVFSEGYSARYRHDTYGIRAMVGIKLNFGSGTLFERDRSGASLDPLLPMALSQWNNVD